MVPSHLYQNFSVVTAQGGEAPDIGDEQRETEKLNAFEAGYQAGWDDAVSAQGESDARLTEDFVQSVQDISFTYHEALAKLTLGMKPLLTALMSRLLPEIADRGLVLQIAAQLGALLENESGGLIEIAVSPEKSGIVKELLDGLTSVPFTIAAEPALSSGQAYLRAGQTEREVNLDQVCAGISEAIDAFFQTTEQEADHD